jgi:ribonuclease E
MVDKIFVDAIFSQEIRVAVLDNKGKVCNFDYESNSKKLLKGNIYLAKVTRVEPSLQAAFVEYEDGKHGFLPFAEIHPDYYQIPAADKLKLKQLMADDNVVEKTSSKVAINRKNKIIKNKSNDSANDDNSLDEDQIKHDLTKKYKIQEVVKKQQLLLVQVIKEERGNKGVSLSTYISLAGRHCVLMPNSTGRNGGISRKIDDAKERSRLKSIIDKLDIPKNTKLILRTAVIGAKENHIHSDFEYLISVWNDIRKSTLNAEAPALIHKEADIITRVIRDHYKDSASEIVIEGDEAFTSLKKLAKNLVPEAVKKMSQYKNKKGIFEYFNIEKQIDSFYNTEAELPSGGYLIINMTEALVSIDVNSGKATKQRSVEETALKTNIEAAREIARQVKIRDLSGLVVVDFIDMLEVANRKLVEKELRTCVSEDRARIQLGRISNLGLLEFSRQRLKPSLIESNMVACKACQGTGLVKSFETRSVDIIRSIRREVYKRNVKLLKVFSTVAIVTKMINYRRNEISSIEKQFNVRIFFFVDQNLNGTNFYVTSTNSFADEDIIALQDDLEIKSLPNTTQKFKSKPQKKEGKKDLEHKNFIKDLFGKIYK